MKMHGSTASFENQDFANNKTKKDLSIIQTFGHFRSSLFLLFLLFYLFYDISFIPKIEKLQIW